MKINHITHKLLIPLVACIVLSACNGSSGKAAAEGEEKAEEAEVEGEGEGEEAFLDDA